MVSHVRLINSIGTSAIEKTVYSSRYVMRDYQTVSLGQQTFFAFRHDNMIILDTQECSQLLLSFSDRLRKTAAIMSDL